MDFEKQNREWQMDVSTIVPTQDSRRNRRYIWIFYMSLTRPGIPKGKNGKKFFGNCWQNSGKAAI